MHALPPNDQLGAVLGGFGGLFFLLVIYLRRCSGASVKHRQGTEYERLLIGNGRDTDSLCLAHHETVGSLARYSVPLVIILTMALFAVSNLSYGASVIIKYKTNTSSTELPSTFTFTLANSVHDMWNAKVYALSLLIAVASGAWPYIKLVLMLFAWLLPPRVLGIRGRERFLQVLDALGKWSLIDSYVLAMMIVAFHFNVPLEEGSVVEVVVLPQFGFYGFLFATMVSLIATHVVLHFHRTSTGETSHNSNERFAVAEHAFEWHGRHYTFNVFGRWGMQVLLWGTLAVIVGGSLVPSFRFDFRGLAGYALELLKLPTGADYSLIDLGLSLPAAADKIGDPGLVLIQLIFFLFAFCIPLAHLALMAFIWHAPVTERVQRRLFTAAEILNAWSALDVFVVSLITALMEIRQFAAFVVGSGCDPINQFLANSTKWDKILDGDDVCFDAIATLEYGCWTLFAASVFWLITTRTVMSMCHKALRERQMSGRSTPVDKAGSIQGEDASRGCCKCNTSCASCMPCLFTELGYRT